MTTFFNSGENLFTAITFWLCFSTALPAYADELIYKWTDKNGVVSYSQTAPLEKGAHDVTSITIETMPLAEQRAAKRLLANLVTQEHAKYVAQQKRLKQVDQQIDTALQRLAKAERRLAKDSVPTGSDRVGNSGGHARLRESYFERVTDLQNEVDQAQQAVRDGYALRDQIYESP